MEKVTVVQGKTQVVIDRSCLPAYLNAGWQLQEKEDTKKGRQIRRLLLWGDMFD